MRMLIQTSLVIALMGVSASHIHAAADISGYRTPKNTWRLGADLEDVDLDGFAEIPSSSEDEETYVDLRRTIQFDGEDTSVGVMLVFMDEKLSAITINIDPEDQSHRSIRKYYKERYSDLDEIDSTAEFVSWVDSDGDVLSVAKRLNEDGDFCAVVVYMRSKFYRKYIDDSLPGWMVDVFETMRD